MGDSDGKLCAPANVSIARTQTRESNFGSSLPFQRARRGEGGDGIRAWPHSFFSLPFKGRVGGGDGLRSGAINAIPKPEREGAMPSQFIFRGYVSEGILARYSSQQPLPPTHRSSAA
jgi:hypothetical protein